MVRGDNAFDLINSRSCFLTYMIIVVNFERAIFFHIYMSMYHLAFSGVFRMVYRRYVSLGNGDKIGSKRVR